MRARPDRRLRGRGQVTGGGVHRRLGGAGLLSEGVRVVAQALRHGGAGDGAALEPPAHAVKDGELLAVGGGVRLAAPAS
jgi:hypothetical protein